MTPEAFSEFRHNAVHDLMRLNKKCEEEFRIDAWPRWDYDLSLGTLTFSEDGVPKVRASIHVVGTTSRSAGTWMWGWANKNLPTNVTKAGNRVRQFGDFERISQLTQAVLQDDEYLGWAMTAVSAKILEAKGAYRCPDDDGFLYFVYSSIEFVQSDMGGANGSKQVECSDHGTGFATYICEHLFSNAAQEWFSRTPDEENQWPDAWCSACDKFFQEQDEWNEKNESKTKIKLICHHCYLLKRSQGTFVD
jgi:hypothetical protein